MRTLRFAKEERKSERERERERERAREKELEHRPKRVVHLEKKGRHTKSQIFWFWTLEERERDRIETNRFRSYRVLPGSHDNL